MGEGGESGAQSSLLTVREGLGCCGCDVAARQAMGGIRDWWERAMRAIKRYLQDSWNDFMGYHDAEGRFRGSASASGAAWAHSSTMALHEQPYSGGLFEPEQPPDVQGCPDASISHSECCQGRPIV